MMNTPFVGLRKVIVAEYLINRNFRAEAVDVEDPFVNVPDTRGEMVIVCDNTD
jgi:hypothetical protein